MILQCICRQFEVGRSVGGGGTAQTLEIAMSEAYNGGERRAFGRRHSCIHATLLVPGRPPSPCVVRNFSAKGAQLELSELIEPPFNVKVRLNSKGNDLDCEVRHVRGLRMGISFIGAGVAEELARALGGTVRRRQPRVLPPPGSMPRVSGSDLRRAIFRRKQPA